MNHKKFEALIFESDGIAQQDRKALFEHLQACESCARLDENWCLAEAEITSAPLLAPAPGFSGRWQARLEQDRRRHHLRLSLGMLSATSAAAGVFLLLFGAQFTRQIAVALAPAALWIARAGSAVSLAGTLAADTVQAFEGLPAVFPILLVMAFFAALGAGAILWLLMLRKLARVQGLAIRRK